MMRPKNADRNQHAKLFSLLLLCLLTCITSSAWAGGSIPLTWDPSTDSDVAGYKIYYGTTSHGYTTSVDVGNVLSATITSLSSNTIYYFAATTYTASGIESDFSNEAAYLTQSTPPPPVYVPPTLNALGNIVINENAGLQMVNLSGIGLGNGQAVTITATSSNPSLIPNPVVNYTSADSTGSLTFAPTLNANGATTITVTANNGLAQNNTVTRTFTVTVAAVNQPPTLNPIGDVSVNYSSTASTAVNLAGISSGAANESQKLTVTVVSSNPSLVANPTVAYTSPNTTGTLAVKTASNASGTATITITVSDTGTSNNVVTQMFTVTVTPVYLPPTLNALGNLSINQNASLQTVNLSGIGLGTGSAVTITAVSDNPALIPNPVVNYTSPNTTGSLNFTPVTNTTGTATITVTANNGLAQSNTISRTFTVTVAPVNQIPTLNPISNQALTYSSSALTTVNLSGISSGAANENQNLTVTAVSSNPQLIANPTVAYTSPTATGTLTLQTVTNISGTATITVSVNDGGTSNNIITRTFTATVTPVYQPPTLDALSNVALNENAGSQTVNLTGIGLGNGQTLGITAVSSNPSLIPNPTVNYTSPGTTGSLTFAPAQYASGSATITVTANNGLPQNNIVTRTFTVSVAAVNQTPTLNPIADVALNFSSSTTTPVSLSGITSGAANENQKLTITAVSSNPLLVANPTVTYTSPNTTGTLGLKTASNTNGTAIITVTVSDTGTSNNVVIQTFAVTVTPVYLPPTLNALANLAINQNVGSQTASLTGIGLGSGSTLSITAVSDNPALIPNPVVNYTSPNATGSLNFTPVSGTTGTATITITANNGQPQNNLITRTFTIDVVAVIQPPTLDALSNVTISENVSQQTVNLTGISLGSGPTMTISAVSSNPSLIPNPAINYTSPANNGTLTFAPALNANGTATITVTANNGFAQSNTVTRTFTVNVASVNQAPTLNSIADVALTYNSSAVTTVNLSGISSGAANESQKLTVTAVSSNPSLVANPTATYTSPNATGTLGLKTANNTNGTAIITVTVSDTGTSNNVVIQTFAVTVTPTYQTPTLNALGNLALNQNAGAQSVSLAGISLGSGSTLTITAVSDNPALIPNPTVSYTSPSTTGSLSFTPTSAWGTANITVTANNGQPQNNLVTRTFTVTVAAGIQPPTLDALGNLKLTENPGLQTINLTGISLGSGSTLTITASSSNPSLIPNPVINYTSPNATGTLSFTPANDTTGTAAITVTVNNGFAQSNLVTRIFYVGVSAANQAPTLSPIGNVAVNYSSTASTTVNLSGISSGAANESQQLTVTAISSNPQLVAHPTVTYTSPSSAGALSVKTAGNVSGTAYVTVTVNDGGATNNLVSQTFAVTVTPVYLPPTLNALANLSVNQNAGLQTVSLTGIGLGSGSAAVISAVSDNPALIPNPAITYTSPATTGSLKFTPLAEATGIANITVTVNNGQAQSNLVTRTFTITVAPDIQPASRISPTLDDVSDLNVAFNSVTKRVSLTGINPGANGTQKLKITAVSSNPKLVPNPKASYFSPQTTGFLDVKPALGTNGTAVITVTVNDGGVANNLVTRTFTVTVAPNQAPTIDPISDLTLAYNSAAQAINLTGITPGTSDEVQKLKITAISSNPSLVPNPKVSFKSPQTMGTMSFKPVANATGTALITVFVNDGAKANNLTTRTFTITVGAAPGIAKAVASAASGAPNLAATLTSFKDDEGNFSITVDGASGYEYRVEASADLVHWTSVNTNTAPFTFVDGEAKQFAQRFYRAVSLPTP